MMYQTPNDYFFRIHHVRPRFKGDIENVLLFMATEIAKLNSAPHLEFKKSLNDSIRQFTGNATKDQKTIDNWRTEISALFAFFIEQENGVTSAGRRAKELANNQDLVEMFKKFLFTFQYPAAHIANDKIEEQIKVGIHFKPARYILKVLQSAEKSTGKREFVTREEVCHCILNDLRCTRDNENPTNAWTRIFNNRQARLTYDSSSDVIRYAGDILDYMEIANLIVAHDGKRFYLNNLENETVIKFVNSNLWFAGYDSFISQRAATLAQINQQKEKWFNFANTDLGETDFATDILAFISNNAQEMKSLKAELEQTFDETLANESDIGTKEIGDMGESLVHSHECQRIKNGGRLDLIHLIKRIPTHLAIGYDIQSIELDEHKRYIEVKSTISSKPLLYNKIHMTTNEWRTAETLKDRYFIYRLVLNKYSKKLFIIQDPVGLFKRDIIQMIPRDGADISFNNDACKEEILLSWTN
jgi:hypothetical protein